VELYIDVGDKGRNKEFFETLKNHEREIETQIGIQLRWESLEDRRASRISALIPFRLAKATPEEIEAAQAWGVNTMLKFIDAFTPFVRSL
jgi:hypothetical protein